MNTNKENKVLESELHGKLFQLAEAFDYHASLNKGRQLAKHATFSEIAKAIFHYSDKLKKEEARKFGEA